ncbi:phospholipase SGR2 [Selaginella moellendorffii]|uniref:phospholipase SGR2 n=1 Tax=Selaginella moellendorffii TaxID=88036 RepID=UPI000D1C2E9A|nr:phospholipase SGR2 [Selaginella moellendorffii]|eukprot:XP_024522407.1 phospholipase SGR2 [Selaginella moellendorffii]
MGSDDRDADRPPPLIDDADEEEDATAPVPAIDCKLDDAGEEDGAERAIGSCAAVDSADRPPPFREDDGEEKIPSGFEIVEELSPSPSPPPSPSPGKIDEGLSSPLRGKFNGLERKRSCFTKYVAQTTSPSDGDDVRWYFCKTPLGIHEAAASVPSTEIVGKGEFFRFSVRDSLSLEESYLEREEELVALWWKEYAECSEGPSKSKRHDPEAFQRHSSDFYEEAVGVPVKGGLYEVDLDSRRCFPVYWGGEHRRVLRGHWFAQRGSLDWLPLREDIAEQLEFGYRSKIWLRRSFQPSGQFAARLDFHGATQGLHALFTGEEDSWEAWLNVDASGITSVLGLKGTGCKLRRGFILSGSQLSQDELRQKKEEEMDDYCSEVPVQHLVFMVHGIGQRLEKANLVDDVGTFRRTAAMLAEKHLTKYQRHSQRVLFIPCQWRRHLKLGGEAAVENCTLEGVRALRTMIGATVHDVLYYMSPIYCQDIIDSVSSSLNRLYEKFMRRNPGYNGKISIYGHSLGSVLSYDILCHQESLTSMFPIQEINLSVTNADAENERPPESEQPSHSSDHDSRDSSKEGSDASTTTEAETESDTETERVKALRSEVEILRKQLKSLGTNAALGTKQGERAPSRKYHTPQIRYTKLLFQVDTFFAVGSPLGLFLSLRNVRLGSGTGHEYWEDEGIEEEMPACRQMMNIFHPYDPVAYRVEPLISKDFVDKKPEFIPYHKGGKRLHIGMQEFGEDLGARSRAFVSSIASVGNRVASAFVSSDRKLDEESPTKEERSYGSMVMERLSGSPNGRVDFMLQDSTFEHQYISAISSHTNYWHDLDTALFIVRHLYQHIPEESPAEEEAKNRLLSDFGGYIENDDVSFTFSSKEGIAAEMAAAEKAARVYRVEV